MSEIEFVVIFLFIFGMVIGYIGGFSSGALHEMKKCDIRMKMFAKHQEQKKKEDEEHE